MTSEIKKVDKNIDYHYCMQLHMDSHAPLPHIKRLSMFAL